MAALVATVVGPVATGLVESLGIESVTSLGGQILTGLVGAVGSSGAVSAGKYIVKDLKRGYENLSHHHGPDPYHPSGGVKPEPDTHVVKWRRLEDSLTMGFPSAAGNAFAFTRTERKHKLRSGRLRKKNLQLYNDYILRWSRVYPFSVNSHAYPVASAGVIEEQQYNPGYDFTSSAVRAANTGRLMLNHVNGCDFSGETYEDTGYMLPYYMVDLTCWRNQHVPDCIPVRRLAVSKLAAGSFFWVPVATQSGSTHQNGGLTWNVEQGIGISTELASDEDKAILKWSDIRLNLYASRFTCSKVYVEFVQFKDPNYLLGFHQSDPPYLQLTADEQKKVHQFWVNEVKKHIYNPIDVQMGANRSEVIKLMSKDYFCLDPASNEVFNQSAMSFNVDQPCALPCTTRTYFKRFNRLCNFDWEGPISNVVTVPGTDGSIEGVTGGLETPAFQTSTYLTDGQRSFVHPKARVYMIIRADDYSPCSGTDPYINATTPSKNAYNTSISFDMIVRNKWMVQD